MASGENYSYNEPGDKRNAGYDQPSDPPAYTPQPSGNHQQGPYPTGQYPPGPQGPQGYYPPSSTNNNNINVVTNQPQTSTIIMNMRPSDYLGWSIFTLLCCCFPIGIAAIVFSCNSRTAADNMNFDQARSDGSTARILNTVGLLLGLVSLITTVVLFIVLNA